MRKLSLFSAKSVFFVLLSSGVLLPACGGSQPPPEPPPPAAPPPPVATVVPATPPPPAPAPAPVATVAPPPEAPKPHSHHQEMIALLSASLDALDLTADQKTTVEGIKADLAKHGEIAKEPREKLEADVNDGVSAGKIDHAKTDADIKAMSAAVAATEPAMQDDMNRLHKALTPEQRKKFVETMREKGKSMHEGMGHEGMGMGHEGMGMGHEGMGMGHDHDGMPHDHDHASMDAKDKGGSGPADHAKEHENKGAGHMDHEGPNGMGVEGVLGKLTEDLGLTPEQKDKLRAKLDPQLKSQHAAMKDKMMAGMKHMEAIGTAFETDKFDAKKAGVGTMAPDMVKAAATAKVQFVETVLSVLTPDQRPKLLAHIKAQEAMMMD